MPSILSIYIFKELISPFTISLIVLTLMFLMTRIPEITNMVVNYNAGLYSIIMLILYTLPRLMEFSLPMSVMLSVLLTMMRMSNDNEITALKGSGISIKRVIPPVFTLSVIGTILSLFITIWGVPWGRFSFASKGLELAKQTLNFTLKERQFNNVIDNIMIYITSIDINTSDFSDIFIQDSRNPDIVNITVASKGILLSYTSKESSLYRYTLRLSKGVINQVDITKKNVNAVSFDTYDINFDTQLKNQDPKEQTKDFDEMYLSELIKFIKSSKAAISNKVSNSLNSNTLNPKDALYTNQAVNKMILSASMQLHEKFAIPFACIPLGLLSIAVGINSSLSRRSSSFGLALAFFLFYYLLLAAAWSGGETGYYPPFIGMWLPNIVVGIAAVYMFSRLLKEKPITFLN